MGFSSRRLYPCCCLETWKWLLLVFIHLWSQWTIFDGYFQNTCHRSSGAWQWVHSASGASRHLIFRWGFANQPSMWTKISGMFQHLVESMSCRMKVVKKVKGVKPSTGNLVHTIFILWWIVTQWCGHNSFSFLPSLVSISSPHSRFWAAAVGCPTGLLHVVSCTSCSFRSIFHPAHPNPRTDVHAIFYGGSNATHGSGLHLDPNVIMKVVITIDQIMSNLIILF